MPKPVFRSEFIGDISRHSLFLHEVAHPDIAFTFDSDIGAREIVCDRRQIGQALTNIVKNAVEATESIPKEERADGSIEMRLHHDRDGKLVISVQDNGVGLPAERARNIDHYMTTPHKGTGLRLATVTKIVEDHVGALAIEEEKPK